MTVLASLLLTTLAATADKEETAPPSVTAKQVVAVLERTESAIRNLAVHTEYVKLQKFALPVAKPVQMQMTTEFLVDREGRTWYECVGEQVNIGQDGVRTYRGRWRAAYDGQLAATLTGGADEKFHFATLERSPSWHGVNPLEFTTHYSAAFRRW
jgi:hypothetical protein